MPQSLVDEIINRNSLLLRQTWREIKEGQRTEADSETVACINYFDGDEGADLLTAELKRRFAVQLQEERDEVNNLVSSVITAVTDNTKAAAIDQFASRICVGMGRKVAHALASLFNQPDRSWDWVRESKSGDQARVEECVRLMTAVRDRGQFETAMSAADYIASAIDSSAVHVHYLANRLVYDTPIPNVEIWAKYGTKIIEDGIERPPDYSDLEDASAVILCTASDKGSFDGAPEKYQYLAYIGRCDPWPEGRMVTYWAERPWPVPEVGAQGSVDTYYPGTKEPCNPLSWVQNNMAPGLVHHEYPVTIMHGGHRMRSKTEPMSVSTNLKRQGLEMDLHWTQVIDLARRGARGTDVFTIAPGHQLPRSLDLMVLQPGDTYGSEGRRFAEFTGYANVIKLVTRQQLNNYNVPGFMVLASEGGDVPSGIALVIEMQPLLAARDRRIAINRNAVDKLFDIERGLLAYQMGNRILPVCGPDIKQIWNPGTMVIPQTESERIADLIAAEDAGLNDHVGSVKSFHRLPSDADALALIEKWREPERQAEGGYDGPTKPEEQQQGGGLFGGFGRTV